MEVNIWVQMQWYLKRCIVELRLVVYSLVELELDKASVLIDIFLKRWKNWALLLSDWLKKN